MRIGIVHDSATTREVLRQVVLSVSGRSVAWLTADGAEAVRRAAEDRPDAILMGLEGAEAMHHILAEGPCPIVLVTASVTVAFSRVREAMSQGARSAVNAPVLGPDGKLKDGEALLACLAELAGTCQPMARGRAVPHLVALGASTGGPEALAQVLEVLPEGLRAAVVVVQHIGRAFADGLANWLQTRTRLPVRVAREGDVPEAGAVLVAGTDDHLVLGPEGALGYTPMPCGLPYHPSIDVFFESVAANCPRPGVAVLLTGMGADGARGLGELRKAGWLTIAQDEATSVVYGMPKAAREQGAAGRVLALAQIGPAVMAHVGGKER